jgi:hypothetical protein
MTLQDYCVVNGEKYNTGTIFIIDWNGRHREAAFICYFPEKQYYKLKIDNTTWIITEKDFQKKLVTTTNKKDSHVRAPVVKTQKDAEISSLFLGWAWYIFFMAVGAIFKNAIVVWILVSVIFFDWRKGINKKEGTYIEW